MPNGMKIMRRFMDFEAAGLGNSSPVCISSHNGATLIDALLAGGWSRS
jgi:hypothetical protein